MRIKKDFLIKTIANEHLVVPVGSQAIQFNGIMSLNKTGMFLFEALQEKDMDEDDLIQLVLNRYDVPREQAKSDVKHFIHLLKSKNIIELS